MSFSVLLHIFQFSQVIFKVFKEFKKNQQTIIFKGLSVRKQIFLRYNNFLIGHYFNFTF